ncbi:MAG: TolC family protein [Flavobacteriaceae bacterium]
MTRIKFQIIYFVFALLILSGCKTLQSNLAIPEKKIPENYSTVSTDTTTIAKINWRDYFDDELLLNLIDTALVGNPDLQIILQRIEIARAGVRFSSGELMPKVDGNILAGSTRYGKFTESGQGNATTPYPDDPNRIIPNPISDYFIGLTSTWEIDIWGKLRNLRKSAVAQYLSSLEGTKFVVSNLVADVAISYYELLALDNELDIIRQTIVKQQEAYDVVKLQKEAGRATELAVQQFQATLLDSQAFEKETLQQITEMENKINFLLGRFPQSIERKKETLFAEIPQQISSGVPSQLLLSRPDIREAEYQVQASKFDLKAAKTSFLPNINIAAGLGFQSFNAQFLLNHTSLGYTSAGGLLAPLLNMNALKAQFNKAKANQLTAMYNYQKTILNGYVEVVNELSKLEYLQQVNTLRQQQNDVLIQSVETSGDLYRYGRATYLEVLLAQQNSLETQLELISTTKRQRIATVNIYKALGGGW